MALLITPLCIFCRQSSKVEVTEEQRRRYYLEGEKVQDVFPNWTADQRELLMTGTHPECWEKMFSEE